MGRFVQDIRFAVRTFLRGRFVTVLAVLAFGLGIGVTAAVFSIFNAVLLNSVPYPDPSRLVLVYDTQPALATAPASFAKYHDWRERNRVFSAMGGSTPRSVVLTGAGEAERLNGIRTDGVTHRRPRNAPVARSMVHGTGRSTGRTEGRCTRLQLLEPEVAR